MVCLSTVTHPSNNWGESRVTALIETYVLTSVTHRLPVCEHYIDCCMAECLFALIYTTAYVIHQEQSYAPDLKKPISA